MSVPHLLLVDDSEAALALERSVLAQHYLLSTAMDGIEALERVRRTRPDAVLLDLSMPRMDGETVLAQMRLDPELATIPVIIVSSEKERGEACMANGAAAFVRKPYRKEDLLVTVGRVLSEVQARTRQGNLAVLPFAVADHELGLDLDVVRTVLSMTETYPLPAAAAHVGEFFQLYGELVCVIDGASQLGVDYTEPLIERKLIVIGGDVVPLALCVDRVWEPIEIPLAGVSALPLPPGDPRAGLVAVAAATARGPLAIVQARSLVSDDVRRSLRSQLADVGKRSAADEDVL